MASSASRTWFVRCWCRSSPTMEYRRYARVEIDLEAVSHNVRALGGLTRPGTLFMAVVKADAYGHGAVPVARTALASGADRLAVATIEEAIELRGAGIAAPLHLLSEPPPSAVDLVVEHDLTTTVTSRQFAVALGRAANSSGTEARFHLKVDTGMNRIGVRAEEAAEFAYGLRDFPGLRHEGTFTHFATADVPGDWDFERQLERFAVALEQMRTEGIDPGIVHSANSAAMILHPETHMDMVRCGIALYGLHPSQSTYGRVDLRPAMSVGARVSFVKHVGMGEGVSYGMTYRTAAPVAIATVPVGYADGLHRAASNKLEVLIKGVRCPQVGRITMDQMMIEVPRDLGVTAGEDVVIVGDQGGVSLSMDDYAQQAGTINYETACAFGMRMGRTYRRSH